ncbi:MAG: hypothetical protein ABI763_02295 [Bacteroidota bacterium]
MPNPEIRKKKKKQQNINGEMVAAIVFFRHDSYWDLIMNDPAANCEESGK